nr:probable non-specific lipid-transfer protein 2 [Ipomoea trifida]
MMMTLRKGCTTTTALVGVCIMVTAMLSAKLELTMAQTPPTPPCDAMVLVPCSGAILFGFSPSNDCCNKLKEQTPVCLCEYITQYRQYETRARKAFAKCGVSDPTCPAAPQLK